MKTAVTVGAVATLLLFSCSSLKVYQDWDQSVNFYQYKTYAWHNSREILRDIDSLFHDKIVSAIERQMSSKGFNKKGSDPDVYVTYMSDDDEQLRIDTNDLDYSMGSAWFWGAGIETTHSTTRTYTKGALIVDIWDARAKQLIWRATALDIVSENPVEKTMNVYQAVAKMFSTFPPQKKF